MCYGISICFPTLQISKDEKFIFCTCGTRVNVLQIVTGKIVHSIEQVRLSLSLSLSQHSCAASSDINLMSVQILISVTVVIAG